MTPTLSVVIPTKNEERYLPTVLDALQRQTLQPKEIIVADADSSDNTRLLAKRAGAIVVDGGLPSAGRNRGAEKVTSDLILFLDADVIIDDDSFLEHAVKEFTERKFGIATCSLGVVGGNRFDVLVHHLYNYYVRLMRGFQPHAPGFCILIKRSLHEAIKGFDEAITFCEDHEYAGRASKKAKFGLLNTVKIFVTTRRQERDGRFSMSCKYVLAEFHLIFLGPIRDNKFKYGFGYEDSRRD